MNKRLTLGYGKQCDPLSDYNPKTRRKMKKVANKRIRQILNRRDDE